MSVILGLNEFFHDTAAALAVDGQLVAMVEQERLDRRKHAPGFALGGAGPWEAIRFCLSRAGLAPDQVDRVAVAFDGGGLRGLGLLAGLVRGNLHRGGPLQTLRHGLSLGDPALRFIPGLTLGLRRRQRFLSELGAYCHAEVVAVNHHLAHAASAFYPSGFSSAAVLVVDGMSDAGPTSIWRGTDQGLRLLELWGDPADSLGVLYRTVSLALGFSFMDAGKTMGLAGHGQTRPAFEAMLEVAEDGRYRICWDQVRKLVRTHARRRGEPLQPVHRDLAASLQARLETVGVALARRARRLARCEDLCLAGGVALNCPMNSRILLDGLPGRLFVQPGAMDMGCALGAALELGRTLGDRPDRGHFDLYSGPSFGDAEVMQALRQPNLPHRYCEDIAGEVAGLLARGQVVGWFQGAMEFGPRALGARSILAHPARTETRDRVNRLKGREPFRPLGPAILEERLSDYFENAHPCPHMTYAFRVRPEKHHEIAAVVHADHTARVQTVSPGHPPLLHRLITAFAEQSGLPLVINTSFNRRGEPIVCTPAQAVRAFLGLGLDALAIGSYLAWPREGAAP